MGLLDKFKTILSSPKSKRVDIDARFETMRQAVSGTMSSFRKVRDKENDRIVGLKVCDPDKTEIFEQRFRVLGKPSEGEIAFSIKHPRVVETYEYGLTTKGEQYIVMEFLEGPGLQQLILHRDPALEGRRAELVRQMAEAIDAVHKAGYIHRDICPRNFICAPDLNSLKLIDFGLTLPAKREFMQPGNRTGTPLYMPPEAITGARPVGPSADIYALGAVGFFLLTGRAPFPGQSVVEVCTRHLHSAAEPASRHAPAPVSAALDEVLLRCLAKTPEARFPDAFALHRALRACPESGQWSWDAAAEWWSRHGSDLRGEGGRAPTTPELDTLAVALDGRSPPS